MNEDRNDIIPCKRLRKNDFDLQTFKISKQLDLQTREKTLVVLGKFSGSEVDSLLILEKKPFPEKVSDFQQCLEKDQYHTENSMSNDIYEKYTINGMSSINGINMTVISPATEKHIKKYSKPQIHLLSESPQIYFEVTMPYITKNQFTTYWVDNIIDGTAEADRVLHRSEDDKFVLVTDFKWDGTSTEDLHYLAIAGHGAPRSLRDLRSSHLPLLKEMHDSSLRIVSCKFGVPPSQLRTFVHYPPSFYHLHVHVTHVHNNGPTSLVERVHSLATVIRNIEAKDDYYEGATLDITVQDNDPLFELYKARGHLQ